MKTGYFDRFAGILTWPEPRLPYFSRDSGLNMITIADCVITPT